MSLHELRSVMAWGATVARYERPAVVLASHLLDSTDWHGVESFARFCRMALSGGGRAYVDLCVLRPEEGSYAPAGDRTSCDPRTPTARRRRPGAGRSSYRADHSGGGDVLAPRARG